MQSLFRQLLALLFPQRPSQTLLRVSTTADLYELYHPIKSRTFVHLLPYQHQLVRACITETKFHYSSQAIAMLATVFADWLERQTPAVIVPIPLSATRLRERGYNQVELVVRAALAQKHLSHHLDIKVLHRLRHTVPQTSLKREDRLTNLEAAFTCTSQSNYRDRDIIVIDDVATTGATLAAAAAALRPLNPRSLRCVALAH